jgi:hypothetical protein
MRRGGSQQTSRSYPSYCANCGPERGNRRTQVDVRFTHKADISRTSRYVRFVPKAEVELLSFAGGLSPKSGHRYAPCSQTNCSHCPEPQRALENWIASVETEFSATIVARHADICEDFIHAFFQIEVWRRCRMTQLLF